VLVTPQARPGVLTGRQCYVHYLSCLNRLLDRLGVTRRGVQCACGRGSCREWQIVLSVTGGGASIRFHDDGLTPDLF